METVKLNETNGTEDGELIINCPKCKEEIMLDLSDVPEDYLPDREVKSSMGNEKIKSMTIDTHYQTLDIETESGKKYLLELTPTDW